jgi:DNA polymerase III epsilon subunit family exonuclease
MTPDMEEQTGRFNVGSLVGAIRRAGGRLSPESAGQALFRSGGKGASVARRAVLALAATDPRLAVDEEGMVVLAPEAPGNIPLDQVNFVVVDVETTGMRPMEDRITEVAAVLVRGRELREAYSTLVHPERPVPALIARLTGIDDALLAGSPPFSRVASPLLDFLGNSALVAHNAPFDRGFLNHELARSGREPLGNPVICTVKLARRVLPGLASRRLDALADHFGFSFRQRHRALGDAEVTARVLISMLEEASALGVTDMESLSSLLTSPRRRAKRRADRTVKAEPTAPGDPS